VIIGTMHYWSLKRCIMIRANLQQSSQSLLSSFVNASRFKIDETCKLSCVFGEEMLVLVNYTN